MVYTGYYGGLSAVGGNMIKVQVSNSAPISVDTRFEKAIPDWAFIVKPYKDGLITQEEYTDRYIQQLDKYRENIIGVVQYFNSILAKYINDALGEGTVREYQSSSANAGVALF